MKIFVVNFSMYDNTENIGIEYLIEALTKEQLKDSVMTILLMFSKDNDINLNKWLNIEKQICESVLEFPIITMYYY